MIIEIADLYKRYGDTPALKNINLRIPHGGIVGLIGPNGAGKTTLVETIEGLRAPSSGKISVLGLNPTERRSELLERVGVQLQSVVMPEDLTVIETFRMFATFFRNSLSPEHVLDKIGMEANATRRNRTLSHGQKLRLAIGVALINDPVLIILDEPTSGLDPMARREMHALFAGLRDAHRTLIVTTHYIEEVEQLCDRVIILRAGRIVADAAPSELVAKAGGMSTILINVEGSVDLQPLVAVGAIPQGKEGSHQRFAVKDAVRAVVVLGEILKSQTGIVTDIRIKRPSLEDMYVDLLAGDTDELEKNCQC
jgi:ABC-2 type transport system ATP-binding protein